MKHSLSFDEWVFPRKCNADFFIIVGSQLTLDFSHLTLNRGVVHAAAGGGVAAEGRTLDRGELMAPHAV